MFHKITFTKKGIDNKPICLSPITMYSGFNSFAVNRSYFPNCLCKKLYLARCKDCTDEVEFIKVKILDTNKDSSFFTLLISDNETISPFTLQIGEDNDYNLTFNGGNYKDLEYLFKENGLAFTKNNFSYKVYLDSFYAGRPIKMIGKTYGVFLRGSKVCEYKKEYVNLSFEAGVGCYQLVYLSNDDIKYYSNVFNIKLGNPKNLARFDYLVDDMQQSYDYPIFINNIEFETEEDEVKGSNGAISISNTVIRKYRRFKTMNMAHEQHVELLTLLKTGIIINGESVQLVGNYDQDEEDSLRRTVGSGRLLVKDEDLNFGSNCESDC